MLMLSWNFEVSAWLRFWICLIKICVSSCDITWTRYFGKQNSTLGSVVPLAMFWEWDQSCNLDNFPFVRAMHLLENILRSIWGGTNVWRGSSKSHLLVSRQIWRCLFREEGILNPLAKFYAASQMSEVQAWVRNTQNEAIWVDHMSAGEELFLKTFSAQMRSVLKVWTLFNSCAQALCPEVKDSIVEKLIDTV